MVSTCMTLVLSDVFHISCGSHWSRSASLAKDGAAVLSDPVFREEADLKHSRSEAQVSA